MATFRMELGENETLSLAATPLKSLGRDWSEAIATASSMGGHPKKQEQEEVALSSDLARSIAAIRALAEVAGIFDGDVEAFSRALNEGVTAAGAAVKNLERKAQQEGVSLEDQLLPFLLAKAVTETFPLDEQIVFALSFYYAEQEGITDSFSQALLRSLSDVSPLTALVAKAALITQEENVDFIDSVSHTAAFIRALGQAIGLSDGDVEHYSHVFAEGIQADEDISVQITFVIVASEMLATAAALGLAPQKALQENPVLIEETLLAVGKMLEEGVLAADTITRELTLVRALAEIAAVNDRLRIGGVWPSTTVKLMVLILKAVLSTQIEEVGSE